MRIQILGSGCQRCETLYHNALEATGRLGEDSGSFIVEKIGDPEVLFQYKVWMTPALVIDGEVISSGKLLTPDKIESEILKRKTSEKQGE